MTRADAIQATMIEAARQLQEYDQLLIESTRSGTRFTHSFTQFDDPLYEAFRRHFPDLNVADVALKGDEAAQAIEAEKWSPIIAIYEALNRVYGNVSPPWNLFGILRQISITVFPNGTDNIPSLLGSSDLY